MKHSKGIALLLFLLGAAIIFRFFTPFIDLPSREVFHTRITFQGHLLFWKLLLYITVLGSISACVAILGNRYFRRGKQG